MNNCFPYCLSLLVLLCLLSTGTLAAQNTTSNHTEPEEHHSFTEKLLEHFFEDYGDENGNIIASQLCNFTQKLSACTATASSDPHGHGAEENVVEGTKEELVEHGEDEEEHEEEEGQVRKLQTRPILFLLIFAAFGDRKTLKLNTSFRQAVFDIIAFQRL